MAGTKSAKRESLYSVMSVGVMLLGALIVPAMLFPILMAVALVNVVRHAVLVRRGSDSLFVLVLMGFNGLLFTVSAVLVLFVLPL
ncbi:hypothetical protein [Leifsonia naganoensis]|uniref:Uncharacterized protein n=1 Tax=Leifsonia naganoensis TaxID=150025 RepID=A0A853DQ97_9MICO|nr:hypothetical protein [Leifsonia naganoensis]NYK10437.1 hypothetical protein [Leifsonia naganoensis]